MSSKKPVVSEATQVQTALFFEFDHLVGQVRKASYDVLKSIFDDQALEPVHMSRFGLAAGPVKLVTQLQDGLGVKKGTPKKLAEEVVNGINMHLASGAVHVSDALLRLVTAARERNFRVVGLTALPAAQREALVARLDLDGLGIELYPFSEAYDPYARADAWLKLFKELELKATACLALVTSMSACKAALTAGVRCLAVPDHFTSFQDFGGAYAVVDRLEDVNVAETFEDLLS